jgi:hypothetical protein
MQQLQTSQAITQAVDTQTMPDAHDMDTGQLHATGTSMPMKHITPRTELRLRAALTYTPSCTKVGTASSAHDRS